MTNTFDKSLRLTKIALLVSGLRVFQTKNRSHYLENFIFYFNLIWLYTDVFGEFFWLIEGIQVGKSFIELTLIAPCSTICMLATAKTLPMFYHRNIVTEVIETLRQIHPKEEDESIPEHSDSNDEETTRATESKKIERQIVDDASKFLNFVVSLLYNSSALVTVAFSLLPVVSMGYDYYKKGESDLKLPFLIKYFFDPFTKNRWPLVYFHQVWSTFIVVFNVFGADTILYASCTYIHMHFEILCHRLENMVFDSTASNQRLKTLVQTHQQLIALVDQIEVVFSKSTLFNIISSSILICLSGFNVAFSDDSAAVFSFFTFLMMSLSQISMLCLFGDMIMRSSTKVSEAIYKSKWYDTDQGTKKIVLLIIIRAQKPCKLTAAKFANLNLTAFTTILSRSWSYFALLNTMYN